MKKKAIPVLLLSLSLISCGKNTPSPSLSSSHFEHRYHFIDELPETMLRRPNRLVKTIEDIRYAMDYMAFYRIKEKISLVVDDALSLAYYNPIQAFHIAYLEADLADAYAIHFDDTHYQKDKVISISYSLSDGIASEDPMQIPSFPIISSYDYKNDYQSNLNFPIEERTERVSCSTSEQLFYLSMNGYRPRPVKESMADTIYQKAKSVLNRIISPEMDDFHQIKAVYDYLTSEIYYDAETAYSTDTYLVKKRAYYLEGVFLNHAAVCDGKAKAYALLLNTLGIPCYRLTGVNAKGGDHAWNIVNLENKWYVSCTTYGESALSQINGGNYYVSRYNMLLQNSMTPYQTDWDYSSYKKKNLQKCIEKKPYDIYAALGMNVSSLDELKTKITEIHTNHPKNVKVEFNYTGDDNTQFQKELIDYVSMLKNANAAEIKNNYNHVYQIIFLSGKTK